MTAVAQLPVRDESQEEDGPVELQVPMQGAQNRLLQKLVMAEKEAAEFGAIADDLMRENVALKKQVKALTDNVRGLESALFAQQEEKQYGASDDEGDKED